jgi:hypothetical protein
MAIDYATAAGQVRLLISDVDETRPVLSDDHVTGYLALHGLQPSDTDATRAAIKRTAADALDAIATSEVLVSKVIRSQDLSTDGAKVADALRKHAAQLRAQADVDDDAAADVGFAVAEFEPYPTRHAAATGGWL